VTKKKITAAELMARLNADPQSVARRAEAEHDPARSPCLAVAIAGASDDEVIGDVITLARDSRHGPSRLLLLGALERSKDPRSRAALMGLGTDPELEKEIQVILCRLRGRRDPPRGTP
jgi:hypothetical protein